MQEEFDSGLEVEVLASALKMGQAESADLLETIAARMQALMPDTTKIERDGWILSNVRRVKELKIDFDDCHLLLKREKTGKLTARISKVVKGVVLKTSDTTIDQWIKTLAEELSRAAKENAETRQALTKFVTG